MNGDRAVIREFTFDDKEAMQAALLQYVIETLSGDLQQHSLITLLLSGGSTPGPLYRQLGSSPLPWERIHTALVDERWVDQNDDASNEKMIRNTLLAGSAQPPFTPMKNAAASARDGLAECENHYLQLPQPIALSILGMGSDGHTASLFPGAQGLEQALQSDDYCAAIDAQASEVTGAHLERMTVTPATLIKSQRLALLINGQEKWDVYQQAKQQRHDQKLPVSLLLHQQRTPVDVFWAP